jgi:hypothetical protein
MESFISKRSSLIDPPEKDCLMKEEETFTT